MFKQLYTFIKSIKYNNHPSKIEAKARDLVLYGSNQALFEFQNQKFHGLIKFDQQTEEDQNRLFNELTVTNIVLIMLLIDQKIRESNDSIKTEYYKELRKGIPEFYSAFIRRINIPENLAVIWDMLVIKRFDQYEQDMIAIRGEFMNQNDKTFQIVSQDNNLLIFQATVLGMYEHLVKGQVVKGDPLYKHLQEYLVSVYKYYKNTI